MPYSLRVKIKKLRYKGVITDKDCDRLIMALNNIDVLDKIKEEIKHLHDWAFTREEILRIIDKYKAESEVQE